MKAQNKKLVCAFGTYRDYYSRNQCMLKAFEKMGCEVVPCHKPLLSNSSPEGGKVEKLFFILVSIPKILWTYLYLFSKALFIRNVDLIYVGYIGHLDIFPAKILSKLKGAPLIFDVFVSLQDTIITDRKLFGKKSLPAKILGAIDKYSCKFADHIYIDTEEQKDFFCSKFDIPQQKISVVPVIPGVESLPKVGTNSNREKKIVLQYSYFAPLHGLESVLEAAALLEDNENIEFHLIGKGQMKPFVENEILSRQIPNVKVFGLLPKEKLFEKIQEADICLGIFGKSKKVGRVIPNKVLDSMYMKKPVITGDSPAIQRFFANQKDVIFCEPGNGASLANGIETLLADEQKMNIMPKNAFKKVQKNFSFDRVIHTVQDSISKLVVPT